MWSISLELILWFHKSCLYSSGSYAGLQLMCIYGWEGCGQIWFIFAGENWWTKTSRNFCPWRCLDHWVLSFMFHVSHHVSQEYPWLTVDCCWQCILVIFLVPVTLDTFVLQSMSELNFKLMNYEIKSLPCCVIGNICRWGGVTDTIWWISYFL